MFMLCFAIIIIILLFFHYMYIHCTQLARGMMRMRIPSNIHKLAKVHYKCTAQ